MDDRLHIAAMLLGNLISTDQGKALRDRLPEIRHCVAVADFLIGHCTTTPPCSASSDRSAPIARRERDGRALREQAKEFDDGERRTLH